MNLDEWVFSTGECLFSARLPRRLKPAGRGEENGADCLSPIPYRGASIQSHGLSLAGEFTGS